MPASPCIYAGLSDFSVLENAPAETRRIIPMKSVRHLPGKLRGNRPNLPVGNEVRKRFQFNQKIAPQVVRHERGLEEINYRI